MKEVRRPSLATIVGSGLAVVAAGSLLAFSSLAEQAGLEGLATGGIRPQAPGTHRGRAITLPAPVGERGGSARDAVQRLVDETLGRGAGTRPAEPVVVEVPPVTVAEAPPAPTSEPPERDRPARPQKPAPQTPVAAPEPDDEPEGDGGKYEGAPQAKERHDDDPNEASASDDQLSEEPDAGEAETEAEAEAHGKKPKKPKKTEVQEEKAPPAKGHSKHGHDNDKGKGHSKHGD